MYCHSYSNIHGNSDKGGVGESDNPWTVCVLSELL